MNLGVSSHLHRHTVVKDQRPLPLIPRALRRGFERTGRTQRLAADVAWRGEKWLKMRFFDSV